MTLDDARLLVAISRSPSLSAAARSLGRSPAAVSTALQRLEAWAQVRLVHRSTRAMELSVEGHQLLRTCHAMLDALAEGERELQLAREQLAGGIRLATPADITSQYIAPWVGEFVAAHPTVRVSLLVSDALHALPGEGVDLALRYGSPDTSGLVATRLCTSQRILVASPAYLARAGVPTHPEDLPDHDVVAWIRRGTPFSRWVLHRGEEQVEVRVRPRLCGDGALVRGWALAGEGLALKTRLDVSRDLKSGRLVRVLPDWTGEAVPVLAVLPGGRLKTARVQALVEFLRLRLVALADACADRP